VGGTVAGAQGNLDFAEVIEQQKREALARAQAGTVTTVRPGIHETIVDLTAVKKAQEELDDAIQNTAEARRQLDDIDQSSAEKEASRLGRLLLARKATSGEIARAAQLIQQYQAEFNSLTGNDAQSEERRGQLLGMIDDLTAASKKEGESSKALLEQQSQARQAFQAAIAAQTPDKADDFEASIDRLVKAAQKAHLGATEIQSMVTDLRAAHTKALNQEAIDLSKEMQAEIAKSTGLQADALRAALDDFDTKMKDAVNRGVVVDPQLSSKLRDAKVEAIALADASDRLRGILVDIDHNSAQGFGFLDSMKSVLAELDAANADFDSAKATGNVQGQEAAQQRINTLLTKRNQLQDQNAAIIAKQIAETASLTQQIAGGIAAIANTAFGLASAFAGANSELTKMLGGIGQAAGGVEALMKQANTPNANGVAPGLSGIFSSASGLLQAAPAIGQVIGGAIGLATTLFGKSPEEIRRLQLQKENNEALRKLTERVGDLGLINVTGTQLTQLDKFFKQPQLDLAVRSGFLGADAVNRIIGSALDAVGLSAVEFKDLMRSFGLSIDDASKITIDDVNALKKAIAESELEQFAHTFEGQMSQFNAAVKVFNLDKPIDQFNALRKAIASITGGGGKLAALLDQFDLTTSEGIAKAEAALQDLFTQLESGAISAADLGGLTPEQFEQLIEQTLGIIRAQAGSGAVAGTGGFNVDRSITEVTGSRLAALLSTDVIWNQQTAENTARLVDLMTGATPPLISAPALRAGGGGSSGPSLVIENLIVQLAGVTDTAQADRIGARVGGAVIDEIDAQLGKRVRVASLQRGRV
jgi:hypothetical protein